jgi:catechol 2,3-dioxygenase-like lactoylglutathione lyase family enzyme
MTALAVRSQNKFHLSLNVANLERSIAFYRILFAVGPAKHYPDYAKFEVEEPAVIFSLLPHPASCGTALGHLGFRLPNVEAVQAIRDRAKAAGLETQTQERTRCGYAEQYRVWVSDPDGNLWAFYAIEKHLDPRDIRQSLTGAAAVLQPPPSTVVWEHFAMHPVPERVPHADGSVDEVRLTGSFNLVEDEAARLFLVREAFRVLRPGGVLHVHGLAADRPFVNGPPKLEGMTAMVKRVPTRDEPLRVLGDAGFVGVEFTKLGDCGCLEYDGIEMREVRLTAYKPEAAGAKERQVLYKGPFAESVDDQGNVFPRGRRVPVDAATWDLLRRGAAAEQFLFLHPNDHQPTEAFTGGMCATH